MAKHATINILFFMFMAKYLKIMENYGSHKLICEDSPNFENITNIT